jgi:D-arabinose 1-dehydrogenase-like Zn-dependent alcohol dehydrogenase
MPETMQAIVKPKAAPGSELRQVPRPEIGPTDVLVKVKVASICGTDLHIYEWDVGRRNAFILRWFPDMSFAEPLLPSVAKSQA